MKNKEKSHEASRCQIKKKDYLFTKNKNKQ